MSHKAFTDEEAQQLAIENAQGASLSSLARKYGTNPVTVRNTFRRIEHQFACGKGGGPPRTWSEAEIVDIVERYANGESQECIAAAHRTSQVKVSRILRTRGGWNGRRKLRNGGRARLNGYITVLVDPDDPFASMANVQGYALEKRLVMARSLGRLLTGDETVHHINGDKTDNRISNLQLRQGRHGKGVALRCGDCGSVNLVTGSLD